jgi:hypothetical protein
MKTCTKCNIEKPLTDFYSHPKTIDGKQSSCKKCCIKTQQPYTRKYHQTHPHPTCNDHEYLKTWRSKNPEYMKEWRKTNPEYMETWRKNNPKYIQDYTKKRKEIDPLFKLSHNIRAMIPKVFKRVLNGTYKKSEKTESILGCTIENFIQHLQNQFKSGMTLENHGHGPGKWNIDHIIPISSARTEEEIYKLSHYTNFQPLWWEENMAKGKKI